MRTSVGKPPRARGNPLPGLAVLSNFEAGEQELLVDLGPALVIPHLRREAHGVHDGEDEPHERPPILLAVLRCGHGVEKPFPLGVRLLARRLRCVERSDQVRNLRTCDRVAEHSASLLDRGRTERPGRHRHNGLSSLAAVSPGVLE
jgi:hypothetical protein